MKEKNGLILHAERELELAGFPSENAIFTDEFSEKNIEYSINQLMRKNVLELLEVFSNQNHRELSALLSIKLFKILASYECLSPIMDNNNEWYDCHDFSLQHKRCDYLFKNKKSRKPYYVEAIIWQDQNKYAFTGTVFCKSKGQKYHSHQYVNFPFIPKTFYIDVIAIDEDNHYIKNEEDLKPVFEYYNEK